MTCFRLQIQGEVRGGGQPAAYRGMIQTALGIVREEVGGGPSLGCMTVDSYFSLAAFQSLQDKKPD